VRLRSATPRKNRSRLRLLVLVPVVLAAVSACTEDKGADPLPGLVDRGTVMTTATPTRQDLTSKVSLTGSVSLNPVWGLAAPIAGQVRYVNVTPPTATPTKPTKVANIYVGNKATAVNLPAGSTFAGRLVNDRSNVVVGTPIVSAKYDGYAIVANIDGAQAYQIADGLTSVQAQITSGPGPFPCTVLGTIAALPAGTIPDPPAPTVTVDPTGTPYLPPPVPGTQQQEPSQSTGMRLVCTPPADVKLINGAAATIEVVVATAKNALVLPVEAVAGSHGTGKVTVVLPDGTTQVKDVGLGLSDGKVIEITSGLTGTETVAIPAPNLQAPEPGAGSDGGGPVPIKKG
jgi:hypothetical protein